jgi:predicted anti-sigma-YlaC factor YlaD
MTTPMMPTEITCRELVELVTEYLDGAMERSERERLEAHLAACGPCRRYLDQMRRTIELAGQLTEEAVTPEAQEELLKVFRAWRQS